MYRVHILTKGFDSPNGIAFLFPFIVYRKQLLDVGIQTQFFTSADHPKLCDCDVLFIESRTVSHRWEPEGDQIVLQELSRLAEHTRLVWFDISDSTGWLQPQVLPFVRWYCKAQLLQDRSLYMNEYYGNRIWADYYHRQSGVTDSNPARSRAIRKPEFLKRLRVSWNSGLADYRLFGPNIMALRKFFPFNFLLQIPRNFTPANKNRPIFQSCRMGLSYERNTVAYQRKRIHNILNSRLNTQKLSRRAYYTEMKNTQLVISPFGYGEITLKDFEATLCGAALFKPSMSHMETWPNLFRDNETMMSHAWDLRDFAAKCEEAKERPQHLIQLATAAQEEYKNALNRKRAKTGFCSRVLSIVTDSLSSD